MSIVIRTRSGTAEERTLLREVIRWARANGWKRDRPERRKQDGTRFNDLTGWAQTTGANSVWFDIDIDVEHQPEGCPMHVQRIGTGWLEMWAASVREAVDVLTALGVLPSKFSSLLDRDEWRVCAGPAEFLSVFQDEITSEGHLALVMRDAQNRWRSETLWVQHRRTGATEWERVAE